jgi:predicted chitinase
MVTMSLTGAHITKALRAYGAGSGLCMSADNIAKAFNEAMMKYADGQFNTINKVAALVSECMMESASFRTTEEYSKNGRYAPYIGRTFIQITWKNNYASFGKWCKSQGLISDPDYFVKNPKQLADLKWAAIGGVWYFTKVMFHGHPLVYYSNDILQVARAVNMGDPYSSNTPAGMSARRAAYQTFKNLGPSIIPDGIIENEAKEFIMAAAKTVYKYTSKDQVISANTDTEIKIDDAGNTSVVKGPNDGVDVGVSVTFKSATPVKVAVWARIVNTLAKDGTDAKVQADRIHAPQSYDLGEWGVDSFFKGAIAVQATSGRDNRLRFIIRASAPITVTAIQASGWKL